MINPFRKKERLYFAVVISDVPTDGFEFKSDKDCDFFLANGECSAKDVIPRTVLLSIADKFKEGKPETKESLKISEKTI